MPFSHLQQKRLIMFLCDAMNHLKLTNADDLLLLQSDKKIIESQVIKYIMSLKNEGVSYSTIKFLVAPVFTFYQLNDIVLNRKKS